MMAPKIGLFSLQFPHFIDEGANLADPSLLMLLQSGNNAFDVFPPDLSLIHGLCDFLDEKTPRSWVA